jgi:hypothetical protein
MGWDLGPGPSDRWCSLRRPHSGAGQVSPAPHSAWEGYVGALGDQRVGWEAAIQVVPTLPRPPEHPRRESRKPHGQLSGCSWRLVCMGKRRSFEFHTQINLSDKYSGTRERFLTSRSVKRGRWVYDRGERALIRILESESPEKSGSLRVGILVGVSPPMGCRAHYPSIVSTRGCSGDLCLIVAMPPTASRTTDM